uniref:Uncharacterized protein n=1 Tax=Solanum lycopersicum TaxID=4081 RepID=K4AUM1_SOLLC
MHLSQLLNDSPGIVQVDMITPMCSQLTYEGLLDEVKLFLGNNNGVMQLDSSIMGVKTEGSKIKIHFNLCQHLTTFLSKPSFHV